ncbi:MAG: translation initiation factor IF-2 subunit gamma, partial [Nitrososphaerota archaeon]
LFKYVVGVKEKIEVVPIAEKEPLVLNVYSAVTTGIVTNRARDRIEISLTRPIVAQTGDKVSISRKVGAGWRLIGYGKII